MIVLAYDIKREKATLFKKDMGPKDLRTVLVYLFVGQYFRNLGFLTLATLVLAINSKRDWGNRPLCLKDITMKRFGQNSFLSISPELKCGN